MKDYFFLQFELRATDFVKGKQAHFSLLKTHVVNTCERSQFDLTLSQVLGKPNSQACLFFLYFSSNFHYIFKLFLAKLEKANKNMAERTGIEAYFLGGLHLARSIFCCFQFESLFTQQLINYGMSFI